MLLSGLNVKYHQYVLSLEVLHLKKLSKKTGKYIPINQYLWIDFFETIENQNININRGIFGSRYDDLIAIYGQEIQKK